jgi:phage tail sheath protein FI
VLQLGSANAGIEIGRFSRFRPQPSGYTTAMSTVVGGSFGNYTDLSRLVAFAQATRSTLNSWSFNDGTGGAVFASPAAPPFSGVGTTFLQGDVSGVGTGSLRNTAAHLDTLAASLSSGIGSSWTVRRTGYRLTLLPNFGTSNTGTAAALSSGGGFNIGTLPNIAAAARSANAQAYAFGGSGTGTFQAPGAPGNNGGVPVLANYEPIFARVERDVDIFNLLCLPRGDGQTDAARAVLWGPASAFCQRERAFLIVDPPADWETVDDASTGIRDVRIGVVTDHAAIYWPRIRIGSVVPPVDPCGTIAGIMARTDTRRGVWKAPAGLEASLLGARGLEYRISDADNGVTNPQAINTLRTFAGGSVVWGARNMAGFDNSSENDYRYVPVRRMALFLEESLFRGLQFAVFEQNDERLWASIRLAAGAFMQNLFRQGAFQGSKASDAYDVRCDSTTTTQNDINLGRVNVLVAFAPLRPAEFVVLTVRQLAGQVQV